MENNKLIVSELRAAFSERKQKILEGLFELLRFQSVSSVEQYRVAISETAQWIKSYLTGIEFETEVYPTSGHPVIVGRWRGAGDSRPTVLFYNHYDVQPVEPLELWNSPPFEPEIRAGQVYARGAQDNKGQLWCLVSALEYLIDTKSLDVNITLIIEGEEEISSPNLGEFLLEHAPLVKADHAVILDCCIPARDRPAVTLGLRGIASFNVEVTSASFDLHSGAHGGIAYSATRALAEILAALHDHRGEVNIPGFYDNLDQLPLEEHRQISWEFDREDYSKTFGVRLPEGLVSPNEKRWIRPALDINGMWGGYQGEGIKTIIPAKAFAKISARLVPGQDAERIGELISSHIRKIAPKEVDVTVVALPGSAAAFKTPINSPVISAAAQALSETWDTSCQFVLEGWSVPIVPILKNFSGADVAMFGFGLASDAIHAPNEHFAVERLEQGFVALSRFLDLLGKL